VLEGLVKSHKLDYLNKQWNGWKYLWIDTEDYGLSLHEVYKIDGKISYTAKPQDPTASASILRHLANLLDAGITFTEKELEEYNEKSNSKDNKGT
jgi:23S rRNA maturation-related 3'-5' exoribonuclease YhaM